MTRTEAIKICVREKEQIRQALDVCAEGDNYVSPDGIITALDYVEAMEMAISALREQKERSKGCEFCCYTEWPDKKLYPKEDDGFDFYAGAWKRIADDDFIEDEVECIKFCPVCGRSLMNEQDHIREDTKNVDHIPEPGKMMGWISVNERLPEKTTDVLMLFEHNMAVGFWHDGDEDTTFWCAYTDDGFYTDCDEEPTHWMPLPEPPEEG